MSKKKRFTSLFTLAMMILILCIGGFQVFKANQNQKKIGNVGVEGQTNSYTIRSNASAYQKELYQDLIDAIENGDDGKIPGLIAQNFIADFFTWTNKVRLNDVGGLQFVHPDIVNNVSHAAQDGIYNDMYTYLSEGKIQNTLQVKNTEIEVSEDVFEIEEKPVDAYIVSIKWEYEEAAALNTSVYQNKALITLVQDEDGLYSIVEVKEHE